MKRVGNHYLRALYVFEFSDKYAYVGLSYNPENRRALLGVIELGYKYGKLDKVETALRNFLELHPGNLDFSYSLAGCYFAQNKLDEAWDEVNKITLFDPNHQHALELKEMIEKKVAGMC